jgi:hypothetical protein
MVEGKEIQKKKENGMRKEWERTGDFKNIT